MANFVKLAATAKRLIDKNGRSVTVVKHGKNPQDSDKPHRGGSTFPIAEVTGKAVFVSSSDLGYTVRDENNIKRSVKVALFAANDDGGNDLETFDVIVDGAVQWKIARAEVLAPADIRLLYSFEVER